MPASNRVQPHPAAARLARARLALAVALVAVAMLACAPAGDGARTPPPTTTPVAASSPPVAIAPIVTAVIATPTPVPREIAPAFELRAAGGGSVSLSAMLEGRTAAALVFYRGLF